MGRMAQTYIINNQGIKEYDLRNRSKTLLINQLIKYIIRLLLIKIEINGIPKD